MILILIQACQFNLKDSSMWTTQNPFLHLIKQSISTSTRNSFQQIANDLCRNQCQPAIASSLFLKYWSNFLPNLTILRVLMSYPSMLTMLDYRLVYHYYMRFGSNLHDSFCSSQNLNEIIVPQFLFRVRWLFAFLSQVQWNKILIFECLDWNFHLYLTSEFWLLCPFALDLVEVVCFYWSCQLSLQTCSFDLWWSLQPLWVHFLLAQVLFQVYDFLSWQSQVSLKAFELYSY